MAEFSKLELTKEQINLYLALRDNMEESGLDSDPQNPLSAIHPSTMSDQVLLAEIIKATDEKSLKQFTDSYPFIFNS